MNKEKEMISLFSDFNQLGIEKELFIERFGLPISKDIFFDNDSNKLEILQYLEIKDKGKVNIVTKFTFKNNELIEQKGQIIPAILSKEIVDKLLEDLSFIKHRILIR